MSDESLHELRRLHERFIEAFVTNDVTEHDRITHRDSDDTSVKKYIRGVPV
jgi:hypothetical protein